MGTDRIEEYKGPCPCGAGELQIDYCTPDHGWPTATPFWYEGRIHCPRCNALYVIQQRGGEFVLVERTKLDTQRHEEEKIRREISAVMVSGEVQAALDRIEDELGSQPSKAAVYRLLSGAGLAFGSQNTFYRDWESPKSWIKVHVNEANLPKYLSLARLSLPSVEAKLTALRDRLAAASKPVVPIGGPFHTV